MDIDAKLNGLLLNFDIPLLKYQIRTHNAFPDVLNVLDHGFKMRSRIVGAGDENVIALTR